MKTTTDQLKAIIKEAVLTELATVTSGDEIELIEEADIPGLEDLWRSAHAVMTCCTEIAKFKNNPEELEDVQLEMPMWVEQVSSYSKPILRTFNKMMNDWRKTLPRRR